MEEKEKAQSRAIIAERLDTTWPTVHRRPLDSRHRARALKRARRAKVRGKAVQKVTESLDLALGHARIMQLGTASSELIVSFSTLSDNIGRSLGHERLMMLIL